MDKQKDEKPVAAMSLEQLQTAYLSECTARYALTAKIIKLANEVRPDLQESIETVEDAIRGIQKLYVANTLNEKTVKRRGERIAELEASASRALAETDKVLNQLYATQHELAEHKKSSKVSQARIAELEAVGGVCGMRQGMYYDSTPKLHVGSSAFENWFQSQPFACACADGIKQISRDSYAAGMGDPLVTYAVQPL